MVDIQGVHDKPVSNSLQSFGKGFTPMLEGFSLLIYMVSVGGVAVWGSEKVAERVGDECSEIFANFPPRCSREPICNDVAEG